MLSKLEGPVPLRNPGLIPIALRKREKRGFRDGDDIIGNKSVYDTRPGKSKGSFEGFASDLETNKRRTEQHLSQRSRTSISSLLWLLYLCVPCQRPPYFMVQR